SVVRRGSCRTGSLTRAGAALTARTRPTDIPYALRYPHSRRSATPALLCRRQLSSARRFLLPEQHLESADEAGDTAVEVVVARARQVIVVEQASQDGHR